MNRLGVNSVLFVFHCFWTVAIGMPSENEMASQYIEKYKYLAMSEMQRTGIPASIKMAQAMLESSMGNSVLASQANNHFGIKCGGSWDGKTYFREDDDYKNGKLVKSCFRKYGNPVQSYIAHSDFLSSQPRYSDLFNLSPTDYKSWAYGLKKAGYATDSAYPTKLIQIIEKHHLYELDKGDGRMVMASQSKPQETFTERERTNKREETKPVEEKKGIFSRSSKREKSGYTVSSLNKTRIVVATGGESLRQIAYDQDISLRDLKSYNDHISMSSTSSNVDAGQIIYLEEKRKSYAGKEKYHVIRDGEQMEDISRRYSIDLEMLYIKNRMPKGSQPLVGEKIYLKGIGKLKDVPKYVEKNRSTKNKRVLF